MAGAVEGLAEAGVAAHVTGHAPPAVGHAPGAVTGALDMGLDQREPTVHTVHLYSIKPVLSPVAVLDGVDGLEAEVGHLHCPRHTVTLVLELQ